jgi:hypothetical protein
MFNRVLAVFGLTALTVLILSINADVRGNMRNNARSDTRNNARSNAQKGRKKPEPAPAPQTLPYLSGEVKVAIKGEQNPVIRLAMAASGVTIVEFPAADKFFAVHPPRNGDWIEVEKSPSLKSDTHLVLRAGKDLIGAAGPAASISVQMRSGLIVTLWIYPVKFISQQTHRCVISYDRDEIVDARRRAGLAVNLGGDEEREVAKAVEGVSTTATTPEPLLPPAAAQASSPTGSDDGRPGSLAAPQPAATEPIKESQSEKTLKSLRGLLKDAAADPKGFKQWSGASNGLNVATQLRDLDERVRVALVAVKNVEADEAIRLLAGHPDLVIQTLDGKGKIIQLERVKQLHAEVNHCKQHNSRQSHGLFRNRFCAAGSRQAATIDGNGGAEERRGRPGYRRPVCKEKVKGDCNDRERQERRERSWPVAGDARNNRQPVCCADR